MIKKILILAFGTLPIFFSLSASLRKDNHSEDVAFLLADKQQFDLHNSYQEAYLSQTDHTNISPFADGKEEKSKPEAVELSFSCSYPSTKTLSFYRVDISLDPDFVSFCSDEVTSPKASFANLMVGKTYYYRVNAHFEGGEVYSSESASFITLSDGPRAIDIDGVTNMRDLGGKEVGEGKKIKQGLLYRCGRLNTSWQSRRIKEITPAGIKEMKEKLGIRSEIDLRKSYEGETSYITSSPLGKEVNYFDCAMEYGSSTPFYEHNKDAIRAAFNACANPSCLPLIFHCDIGTDRTGAFAYLLLGLLGASEVDLEIDYLFSNFGAIGSSRDITSIREKAGYFSSFEGDSLSQKIENYLLSIGVRQTKIDSFYSLMIENPS